MSDKACTVTHLVTAIAGLVAVVLMTAWHDISGTVALVAVLALTGATGAHTQAAATVRGITGQLAAAKRGAGDGDGVN